jgi:hypothetical protein
MKLSDIFEAYLDKFYQSDLWKEIKDPKFTFSNLANYLLQQGIYLDLYDDPVGFGGASLVNLSAEVEHIKKLGKPIPKFISKFLKAGYTHILRLGVDPGTDSYKTLKSTGEKDNIIAAIQHELQHISQPSNSSIQYVRAPKDDDTYDYVKYLIQPLERSNQSIQISSILIDLGLTPEQFIDDVKSVAEWIKKSNSKDVKKEATRLISQLRNNVYGKASSLWLEDIIVANATISTMPVNDEVREIKTKLNLFFKQLKKVYKRVKGYKQKYHK